VQSSQPIASPLRGAYDRVMGHTVVYEVDYRERRSRLATLFRVMLAIPLGVVNYFYAGIASLAIFVAWFAIVFTQRFPPKLYWLIAGYLRFYARMNAYACLLCDPYPPFNGRDDRHYPVRLDFAGPLERYNWSRTFFRPILALPVALLSFVMLVLLEIVTVAAWFAIVITGRMPRGMFDVMANASSYVARASAYLYLLTETYPPPYDARTHVTDVASGVY
jgi:hypothetical protein